MKSLCVALLSRLAIPRGPFGGSPFARRGFARAGGVFACVGLFACGGNGPLFDALPPPEVDAAEAPQPVAPMSEPAPAPTPALPEDDMRTDMSEPLGDDGLPLVGNVPGRPPLTPMPEPEVPEAPAGPAIVSVTPDDGAVGVAGDANIVVRFSAPMDQQATEAAYQSESLPSDSVTFIWNDDSTELTVVPDLPLEYSTGSAPDDVEARRVTFFVSASATDVDGVRLGQPYEFSFSLFRQVNFTLFAIQDRDLSGSFLSNDTYGDGQCARGQINMCVGDTRVGRANEQYRGFISFEAVSVPEEAVDVSAVLSLEITGSSGNPFGGLGGLILEHASFDEIGSDAFSADALDEMGAIAEDRGAGSIVSADVSSAVIADGLDRDVTQYRLRFEDATDADGTSDTLRSAWDTQTIDVSYLIP
jgi:hypothetical protein